MTQGLYTLLENSVLAKDVHRLVLAGDTAALQRPGQFVNIRVEGCYLRRPISVCEWGPGRMTLVCKAVGEGTRRLCALPVGAQLDMLVGLGNGFDADASGAAPLLVGGGVGTPPLVALCRVLRGQGKTVQAALGFASAQDVILVQELQALGVQVHLATADGSAGRRGLVTQLLEGLCYSSVYACGPLAMLRAVEGAMPAGVPGQFSFEERMGCGFGACMGCTCHTKSGPKRICTEGPVLRREEIVW